METGSSSTPPESKNIHSQQENAALIGLPRMDARRAISSASPHGTASRQRR
jgi:hypothetical protein